MQHFEVNLVNLVKTLMSLRGLNQSDLARHSGVSLTAISRYLKGQGDIRAEALIKILESVGTDLHSVLQHELNKSLGNIQELSIGEDIRFLLDQTSPITRKTVTDTLITSFKNLKTQDSKQRVLRLKKYRDSIKTVRRHSC